MMRYMAPADDSQNQVPGINLQPRLGRSAGLIGELYNQLSGTPGQPNGQTNGYTNNHTLRPGYTESGYIRFFKFYGLRLDLNNTKKQLEGPCPFYSCRSIHHETPNSFFASPANGCWDCKYCGRSGNVYDFIRLFHEEALSFTTGRDYHNLAAARSGIPAWVFPQFRLAVNPLNKEWLLPAYNLKEHKITNLYAWKRLSTSKGPVMSIMSGPTFKQILYGLQFFRKDHARPLLVFEGHWDLMAAYGVLYLNGLLDKYDIVATPGDKFPDYDLALLANRDIILHCDNDPAGEKTLATTLNQLGMSSITPKSIYRMGFNATEPLGYDARDIVAASLSPQEAWTNITRRYFQVTVDLKKQTNLNHSLSLRKIPCSSFDDVIESLSKVIYLPDCLKDTAAFMLAVASTVSLGSLPLWGYMLGPSGSTKTTLLSCISSAVPYCFFMSKWTGLVSGYYQQGLGDLSLIDKINHTCICIEDFTPILNETEQTQARLYGELREAYGGKLVNFYRNPSGLKKFDDFKFNILACVTDRIRRINNTDIGERFIICDQDSYWSPSGHMLTGGIDRKEVTKSSIDNVLDEIGSGRRDKLLEQRGVCWGFIDHIATRLAQDPGWYQSKVSYLQEDSVTKEYYRCLGEWSAHARSFVERDREKQSKYKQRVEFGTRLGSQFTKTAIALSLVFDEEPNTERVKGIIRKLALDTGFGYQQDMMLHLAHHPYGLSVPDLERLAGVSATSVGNRIRDMHDLDISIYKQPSVAFRSPGNQPHCFYLSPSLSEIALTLGFSKKEHML